MNWRLQAAPDSPAIVPLLGFPISLSFCIPEGSKAATPKWSSLKLFQLTLPFPTPYSLTRSGDLVKQLPLLALTSIPAFLGS